MSVGICLATCAAVSSQSGAIKVAAPLPRKKFVTPGQSPASTMLSLSERSCLIIISVDTLLSLRRLQSYLWPDQMFSFRQLFHLDCILFGQIKLCYKCPNFFHISFSGFYHNFIIPNSDTEL